ncbi:hypothetical protein GIB67_037195 [Kingdonia uniflora]|uniref:Uncharacterized protein n=1 Tax=Kingdonia uniflora TaxID=39325 RepID=A0A7J7MS45_9MAGN|nr:hypothetical protein GIB67_037195 [Kingdonia uniflora]
MPLWGSSQRLKIRRPLKEAEGEPQMKSPEGWDRFIAPIAPITKLIPSLLNVRSSSSICSSMISTAYANASFFVNLNIIGTFISLNFRIIVKLFKIKTLSTNHNRGVMAYLQNNGYGVVNRNCKALGGIGNAQNRPITGYFCSQQIANAQEIIEISPETVEVQAVKKQTVVNQRTERKSVHTLSSVLSAKNKVACGLTGKPKNPIVDIDAADVDNKN